MSRPGKYRCAARRGPNGIKCGGRVRWDGDTCRSCTEEREVQQLVKRSRPWGQTR